VSERYPPIEPYEHGTLEVGDGQSIYWESVGCPSGTPAVFLHGGPGSGAGSGSRRYFDPLGYRAVLFDQRGSGRSRPLAIDPGVDLSTNTTNQLVGDIEALREHLGVGRWVVVGISWGVTLALVYAQRYPERVRAMVLGPVTAGTQTEMTWITRHMGRIFPRQWDQFVAAVPQSERGGDLAAAYARLLASHDASVRDDAASRWCDWEDTHVSLMPGWAHDERYDDPAFRAVFARLVTHYWAHGCFLADGEVLAGLHHLAGIPGVLIHGRYDISSPLDTAWQLHQAWPASRLVVLDDGGHGGGSFAGEMVSALDEHRNLA
jgi:proline iminopeptidase